MLRAIVPLLAIAALPGVAVAQAQTQAQSQSQEQSRQLRLDGDSSAMTLSQALQRNLAVQAEPAQALPAQLQLPPLGQEQGSAAALQALQAGQLDLAAIGRSLTPTEQDQGLQATPITRHKVAIITSSQNPFKGSLTNEQFAQIFRGEITDWSQVGGPAGPIRVIDRPADSDTRQALARYPVFQSAPFATGATAITVANQTEAVIQNLGPDGIGYAIVDQVRDRTDIQIVPLHRVLPDDQRYSFSQPLVYVTRTNTVNPDVQAATQTVLQHLTQPRSLAALTQTAAIAQLPTFTPTVEYLGPGFGPESLRTAEVSESVSPHLQGAYAALTTPFAAAALAERGTAAQPAPQVVSDPVVVAPATVGAAQPAANSTNLQGRTGFPWAALLVFPLLLALMPWAYDHRRVSKGQRSSEASPESLPEGLPEGLLVGEGVSQAVQTMTPPPAAAALEIEQAEPQPIPPVLQPLSQQAQPQSTPQSMPQFVPPPGPVEQPASKALSTAVMTGGVMLAGAGTTAALAQPLSQWKMAVPVAETGNGHTTNGHTTNGHTTNGHTTNGHASNGQSPESQNLESQNLESQNPESQSPESQSLDSHDVIDGQNATPAEPEVAEPVAVTEAAPALPLAAAAGLTAVAGLAAVAQAELQSEPVLEEQVPVEQAPVEQAPVEQVPVEQALVEQVSDEAALQPDSALELEPEPDSQPEPELHSVLELEPEPDSQPDLHPALELELEPKSQSEPDSEPQSVVASDSDSALGAERLNGVGAIALGATGLVTGLAAGLSVAGRGEAGSEFVPELEAPEVNAPELSTLEPEGMPVATPAVAVTPLAAATEAPQAANLLSQVLLLPRDSHHAFAVWMVPMTHHQALQAAGGQQFALRICDTTAIDLDQRSPHSYQQYNLQPTDQDQAVCLPASYRDYVAEVGYVTAEQGWLKLARSHPPLHTCHPLSATPSYYLGDRPQAEALQTEALQTEALQTEALQTEALPSEALPSEALQTEAASSQPVQSQSELSAADRSEAVLSETVLSEFEPSVSHLPEPKSSEPELSGAERSESPEPVLAQSVLAESLPPQPTPVSSALQQTWITLTVLQSHRAEAHWHIALVDAQLIQDQGGQQMILKIHDAHHIDLDHHAPHSTQDYPCANDETYCVVALPQSDRDYVAEIGYLTADNQWLRIARSLHVHNPNAEYQGCRIVLLPCDASHRPEAAAFQGKPLAYVYWDIAPERREVMYGQGGQQLVLRLHDADELRYDHPALNPASEFLLGELGRDIVIAVPKGNRNYVAEIGYLTAAGQFLSLGRSVHAWIPAQPVSQIG